MSKEAARSSTPRKAPTHPGPQREVFIVDGCRTPFLKFRGKPGPFVAAELAVQAGRALLVRHPIDAADIDEVVLGCVMPTPEEANIARIVALRIGCDKSVPAWTVQRNCASGLQALDNAVQSIRLGRSDLILAGGVEAMSHAPLLWNSALWSWRAQLKEAKSWRGKLKALKQFKFKYLKPVISLVKGLTDPVVGLSMGQTAENLADQFKIDRSTMDAFSVRSHHRAAKAHADHLTKEIIPLYDASGKCYLQDDGVRADSDPQKLGKLKPYFDRFGTVTPGNSSQITDGAAMLLLASREAVERYKLPVLARVVDTAWAGVAPEVMGIGPVHAIDRLFNQYKYGINDIDYWEINEAFAAQVIACTKALSQQDYCKDRLNRDQPWGTIDPEKLNIDGGAISIGHPVGASGARIVLHLCHVLERTKAKRGVATLCIGGGQGGAMVIERVAEESK